MLAAILAGKNRPNRWKPLIRQAGQESRLLEIHQVIRKPRFLGYISSVAKPMEESIGAHYVLFMRGTARNAEVC